MTYPRNQYQDQYRLTQLLITSIIRQRAPSGHFQMMQNCDEIVGTPLVCAAFQRVLERLEKGANRNLMKFNRDDKSCTCGGTTPSTGTGWGLSALAEKD